MTEILRVENLSKSYPPVAGFLKKLGFLLNLTNPEKFALQNISFKANRGETIGLIGFNGSGKSTLLKCLAGVTAFSSGHISKKGSVGGLIELGGGLNPDLSGMENIDLHLTILSNQESKKVLKDKIISFSELGSKLLEPVKTYSSGMMMRLSFSISIMSNFDIFIVDEALSVGDSKFQEKCIEAFFELKKRGTLIFLVTHDDYLIRRYCDRVLLLNRGELKFDGETEAGIHVYETLKNDKSSSNNSNSHGLQIKDLNIYDHNGLPAGLIASEESFTVELDIYSEEEMEVFVVLNFYSSSGAYLHGCISGVDLNQSFKIKGRNKIVCHIENHRLLSGVISLRAAINSPNGLAILAESFFQNKLRISSDGSANGFVNFDRTWKLSTSFN